MADSQLHSGMHAGRGSSAAEKVAYQCMERGLVIQMIPGTKLFEMCTNGEVVQGEQRYLETSGLSVGFRKAAGKSFTQQYMTWCLFFWFTSILELNM